MSTDININKLATLANLDLDATQSDTLTQELNHILDMVNQLQEIDTGHVEPLAHPLDQSQPLRPDRISETNQRQDLQAAAPSTEAGLFLVPQFIETE